MTPARSCDVCPVCGQAESQRCEQCVGEIARAAGDDAATQADPDHPALMGRLLSRRGQFVAETDDTEGGEI